MKKFYTDLSCTDLDWYFEEYTKSRSCSGYQHPQNYFKIYHMFFYMCLLPTEIKLNLFKIFNDETKNTFNSILNINEKFCSSIEECDYVLLPPTTVHDRCFNILENWRSQIISARKNNKKIIFFLGFDDDKHFDIPNNFGYVFRSSGFLSKSSNNVYGLPTVNCDVFDKKFVSKKLSISFCGNYSSSKVRKMIIDKFIDQMNQNCDFILRDRWFGNIIGTNYRVTKNFELINYSNIINNAKTLSNGNLIIEGHLHAYHLRSEYFKSLKSNLYCLCVRGDGNFSFRLGETFMMGRIPILIDTDCILPFRDLIPYDKNCIRIPIENIDNISDIIHDYHNSHTENELIEIQKENRLIWEEYFTPENAFFHINNIINKFKT
jgi:hypothetical protein